MIKCVLPPNMSAQMKPFLDPSIAKAQRLTQLRKLAKLSRKDIAQMVSVSVSTYKGWENARFGGIPERRAALLVDSLQNEGIHSSVNWLMHGTGDLPKKISYHRIAQFEEALANTTEKQSPEIVEQLRIKAELEFFCNNNDWETISLTVSDDAMAPCFLEEDLVAGIKIAHENFEEITGLNCIVRTKNNKVLLRQVQKGKTKGFFTLLCLNQNSKQQFILQDIELVDVAPVIWFRRKLIALPKISRKK